MTALRVENCGPGTTVQDAGRFGWQRYGVGPAGAMDRQAMARANLLVGNAPGAAVIELAFAGMRLRAEGGPVRVAVADGSAPLTINGHPVAAEASATAQAGDIVDIGSVRSGLYAYLAIAGGLALPPQLGALSTHVRSGIGGIDGRALRAGDTVPCVLDAPVGADLVAPETKRTPGAGIIRVMLGPQDDYFEADAIAGFLDSTYRVTPQVDRMGIRLTGPKIAHGPKGYNIVSDGIVTGSIQVPGMGEPLVLLADRQTTGGYPKIATVISADLGRLAQLRPGSDVRFAAVTRDAAVAAWRAEIAALDAYRLTLKPRDASADLSSERLLSLNLLDGWTSDTP